MARDNVSEELQQLRKRARRRLIGAVTLVIFALVVLWTVLDGEPPVALTHPVEIIASAPSTSASGANAAAQPAPAATTSTSSSSQAVAPAVPAAPVVAATDKTTPAPVAPQVLPGKLVNSQVEHLQIEPAPKPKVTPKPAEAKLIEPKPAESKPVEKPAVEKPVKPTPKPVKDPQRILDGMDEAEAPKPAAEKHVSAHAYVQIGAYSDKAKVTEILGKLKANGLPAYGEAVNGKGVALTRIRIAANDDAHAKALLQKAAALGYSPQLVH
ncbi:SPOR domain-containing protein [Andreprevotia chitinilytica]|uniref:SPOR domain-containing protein n=1 Tax=Andreprevotia chitinilytica TaxID=396808 RepID=UPI000555F080|nr:SPOR domain-containing protein [Andreprevotia chitinilytica]